MVASVSVPTSRWRPEVSVVPPERDMTRWRWRRRYRAARRPATKLRDTVWARLAAKRRAATRVAQHSSDRAGWPNCATHIGLSPACDYIALCADLLLNCDAGRSKSGLRLNCAAPDLRLNCDGNRVPPVG
jgi:hypothetical protein